jgi:hypothetical protein
VEPEGEDRREDWDFEILEDEYLQPALTEQEQLI